jgi:hypothetical protein
MHRVRNRLPIASSAFARSASFSFRHPATAGRFYVTTGVANAANREVGRRHRSFPPSNLATTTIGSIADLEDEARLPIHHFANKRPILAAELLGQRKRRFCNTSAAFANKGGAEIALTNFTV